MKHLFPTLAFVFILPNLSYSADTKALAVNDIKKVITTENTAKEAYLWGYPLVRFERTKRLMTTTPGFGHAPLNVFFHADHLPRPSDRGLSSPLPDMLYSSAFLDLRSQPLVMEIPQIKDRFYSLQFMDAFANNIAIVSSRTRGEAAGKLFITGPHYIGSTPAGFEQVRSPTNFVWVVGHIQATSPAEEKSSYKLLRKYQLKTYSVYLGKERASPQPRLTGKPDPSYDPRKISTAGIRFYDELGIALRENEPANLDRSMMTKFADVDVGSGLTTSRNSNTRELREAFERAIASAEMEMDDSIKKALISRRNGWNFVLRPQNGGNDITARAAISRVYFGQTDPLESIHPVAYTDSNSTRLNGNSTYLLRFPKGQLPPVGALWSVAPYNTQGKNLIENSLKRYSLGSYSKGLTYNPDGSLDVYISANEPSGRNQNWLPVPRNNFYVILNMYNPTLDVIGGKYNLPQIQRLTLTPSLSLNK